MVWGLGRRLRKSAAIIGPKWFTHILAAYIIGALESRLRKRHPANLKPAAGNTHRGRDRDRLYGEFSRLSAASVLARICSIRCIRISRAEVPSTLCWIVSFILFHAGVSIISSKHFQARSDRKFAERPTLAFLLNHDE